MYNREHIWEKANIEIFVIIDDKVTQGELWTVYGKCSVSPYAASRPSAVSVPRLTTT